MYKCLSYTLIDVQLGTIAYFIESRIWPLHHSSQCALIVVGVSSSSALLFCLYLTSDLLSLRTITWTRWYIFESRSIKHLHKPLIWNSSLSSCKSLVLIKNRRQAPSLNFSHASHKTTCSVLKQEVKTSVKLGCIGR